MMRAKQFLLLCPQGRGYIEMSGTEPPPHLTPPPLPTRDERQREKQVQAGAPRLISKAALGKRQTRKREAF